MTREREECGECNRDWAEGHDPKCSQKYQDVGATDTTAAVIPRTEAGRAMMAWPWWSSRLIVQPEDILKAILAIEAEASGAVGERGLLDSDDFRDRHERALRDHILDGPDDHACDDLCSGPVIDRLLGRKPANEYPTKVGPAPEPPDLLDGIDVERVWREFMAADPNETVADFKARLRSQDPA